jgi:hypothetical protein
VIERRCPQCFQPFSPSKFQPAQTVCRDPGFQRERRSHYRKTKLASDLDYREACRQSAQQWRKQHPDYWQQYRRLHPSSTECNRQKQTSRDRTTSSKA